MFGADPLQNSFLPNYPNLQWAWDATSLRTLLGCERRYMLSNLERYDRAGVAREAGRVVHAGIESWNRWRCRQPAELPDAEIDTGARIAMRDTALAMFGPEGAGAATWERWSQRDHNRTPYTLLRAVWWYCVETANSNVQPALLPGTEEPAVEVSFAFPIPLRLPPDHGLPSIDNYHLCGHMDGLAHFEPGLWTREYKTTSTTLGRSWANRYNPDVQTDLYDLAASTMLGDVLPVQGVILTGVQLGVNFTRIENYRIARTPNHRSEFLADVQAHIKNAERCALSGHWPMRTTGCFLCDFLGNCQLSPPSRGTFLRADFDRRPARWNPIEER